MKKYYVIGNPIEHSLSPKIHNYWFKKNNINAVYEKKLVKKDEIQKLIEKLKNKEISIRWQKLKKKKCWDKRFKTNCWRY